jgi:Response regulator
MLNKQIAGELGIAEKTVKVHRSRVMQKLGVVSVAELVRFTQTACVAATEGIRLKSNFARLAGGLFSACFV